MSTVPERVGSVSFEVAASQSVGGPAANSLPLVLGSVLVVAFSALFARPWWNRYLGLTNEGWYQFFGSQIVQGRIPYRDFHLFVPPGQALVMAALTAIFGPRLIVAEVFGFIGIVVISLALYVWLTRLFHSFWVTVAVVATAAVYLRYNSESLSGMHVDVNLCAALAMLCARFALSGRPATILHNLYGTTYGGGAFTYYGTLFKLTTTGTFSTLHSFDGTDGDEPIGGMFQAKDGNYYGTTQTDGANGYGTVFKTTSGGTLTTLYNFCMLSACADGSFPEDGLIQGTDGKLYGTTFTGGAFGKGTIFNITTAGVLTTLHSFDSTDGSEPWGGLVQDTNGTFFGTTYAGGTSNLGTVYSLSMGLKSFIKVQPAAAKVGATVTILGTKLTGATKITFNKIAAVTYKVVSSSEITVTVPSGATTGPVVVTAPAGTFSTYPNFRIIK